VSAPDDVRAVVAGLARRPVAAVASASRLTEDLGIRSLERVELAVLLEERLGRPVPDQWVMTARTVGDIEARLGVVG
jgi:acyl carrier protein